MAHLDLVNIDLSILFAQLLVRLRHRVQRHHGVAEVLCGEGSAFDVEGLLGELRELRLVHALLFEGAQSPLLDRVLIKSAKPAKPSWFSIQSVLEEGGAGDNRNLARSIAQLAHLLLVPCEFSVELLDLDLDSGRASICLLAKGEQLNPKTRIYLSERFERPPDR